MYLNIFITEVTILREDGLYIFGLLIIVKDTEKFINYCWVDGVRYRETERQNGSLMLDTG